jgi:hypothetical protein
VNPTGWRAGQPRQAARAVHYAAANRLAPGLDRGKYRRHSSEAVSAPVPERTAKDRPPDPLQRPVPHLCAGLRGRAFLSVLFA